MFQPAGRSLVLIICFVFAGAYLISEADAYTVKSSEGAFHVEMKDEPKFKRIDMENKERGKIAQNQWMLDVGSQAWFVEYDDFARGTVAKSGVKSFYEGSIKGTIQATKGTLVSAKDVMRSGITGRELIAMVPGDFVIRSQIFVRGDRQYQVGYVGALGTEKTTEVQAFFDSMEIE